MFKMYGDHGESKMLEFNQVVVNSEKARRMIILNHAMSIVLLMTGLIIAWRSLSDMLLIIICTLALFSQIEAVYYRLVYRSIIIDSLKKK